MADTPTETSVLHAEQRVADMIVTLGRENAALRAQLAERDEKWWSPELIRRQVEDFNGLSATVTRLRAELATAIESEQRRIGDEVHAFLSAQFPEFDADTSGEDSADPVDHLRLLFRKALAQLATAERERDEARKVLALLPANLDDIAGGLADFLGHSGPLHDENCPGDDTCSCGYYRENNAANAAARLLDALADVVEAPTPAPPAPVTPEPVEESR